MWADEDWIKPKNKIAVAQAWTRDSQRSETKFQSSKVILKYLKLYCEYSSLVGFKYLVDSRRPWVERILWVVIQCITILSLSFIVYSSYHEFVTSPILTSVETDSYHTTNINFPGINICSVNRISRKSAMELVGEIFNANTTYLSFDEILILIMQLGNHYASEFRMEKSEDRNVEVDQLLMTYYKGYYNLSDIMKNLSPQCSDMLLKCKLHGTIRNCSQLFAFRKTQDGYCCIFNYVREADDIPVMSNVEPIRRVHKVDDLGIDRGLSVLLDPQLDDYFYPILPVKGWKVSVFSPYDYPDVSSGGVAEVFAMPCTETFVDVTPTSFFSTDAIEGYSLEKRKCIFKSEMFRLDGTTYSYSNCIVNCKIEDIQKICGCRPFFFPRRGKHDFAWRMCNSADLECLSKYKTKWWTVFPHEGHDETFVTNNKWALYCKDCYPSCDDITYDVLSSKSFMSPGLYKTEFLWNVNITDQTILHVYFTNYGAIRLKQDVAYYWYELMSDIGGTCGVFIGFSFISIVEFLYFVALMLRELFWQEPIVQDNSREVQSKDEAQSQPIRTIYWSELLPRSWQAATYAKGKWTPNLLKNYPLQFVGMDLDESA